MTTSINSKPPIDSPPKAANWKDRPEFDLYAELFASFFTAQAPAPNEPQSAEPPAENAASDVLVPTTSELPADAPHLLPTGQSIAADAEKFLKTKDSPLGLIEKQIKADPTPIKVPSDVKMLPIDTTCSMPPGKTKVSMRVPTSIVLPETGEHMPVDVITLDDLEIGTDVATQVTSEVTTAESTGYIPPENGSIEIEVIEVPIAPVRVKHDASQEKGEPAVQDPYGSTINQSGSSDSTPVVSAVPAAVPHVRHHAPDIVRSTFRDDRIEVTTDTATQKNAQGTTLLETFTSRVLADVRSPNGSRAISKVSGESDASSPIFADSLVKEEQAETGGGDFGFDTSVGGEAKFSKIEQPDISDAKMRRMILDQVGSQLHDMASEMKATGDKRVLTIKLSPAELGGVEITLSKNADGVIDAHFRTDNPHAQHAINETLAQLRDSLERSGMQVGNLNTSCSSSFTNAHSGGGERGPRRFTAGAKAVQTASTKSSTKSDGGDDRLVSLRA